MDVLKTQYSVFFYAISFSFLFGNKLYLDKRLRKTLRERPNIFAVLT